MREPEGDKPSSEEKEASYQAARPYLQRAAQGLDLSGERRDQAMTLRDAVDPSIRMHVGPFLKERWDREFAEQKAPQPKPEKKKRVQKDGKPAPLDQWANDASPSVFAARTLRRDENGNLPQDSLSLGRVGPELASRIEQSTGLGRLEGAIVVLRAEQVRKSMKRHGYTAKHGSAGQGFVDIKP